MSEWNESISWGALEEPTTRTDPNEHEAHVNVDGAQTFHTFLSEKLENDMLRFIGIPESRLL